jgi:arylsulfatase A-like enzyme/tetratricopeptide (TPR) repeat protein
MKKKVKVALLISMIFILLSIVLPTKGMLMGNNQKPNVLLITLDTTRADRLGIYGYRKGSTPNLDAIAREGVLFEAAFTQVPITLPSHCSIMTGTAVPYHKVRNNGKYKLPRELDTLAEILKRRGYTTAAFISSFSLDSRFGLSQGFDVYNQTLNNSGKDIKINAAERKAEEVYRDFSQWFNSIGRVPFFCFVHFFDPHEFYEPPEPYCSRFKENPYDGEIAYMDEYIGKIVKCLKSREILRDTLVVIVGDHGEAFGEHGELGHQVFCYRENLRVPLIISGSMLPREKRVTPRIDLMDVMPTVLDYLGIPVPGKIQGISLLPLIMGKDVKKRGFYIESIFANEAMGGAAIKGWIEGDYKYIDLPRPELYHLVLDPIEKNNLFFKKNFLAQKMKTKMRDYLKKYESVRFNSGRNLNNTEIKRLASLGYITSNKKTTAALTYPDPKDLIASWTFYIKGQRLLHAKKQEQAMLSYREAIRLNPKFSWPYAKLAFLYNKNGNIEAAQQTFKDGIRMNPQDYNIKIDYANLLISQSETYNAFVVLKELEKVDSPEVSTAVNLAKGNIFLKRENFKEALYCFENILKLEPENLIIKKIVGMCLFQMGRMAEAFTVYSEICKHTKTDPNVLFYAALTASQTRKYEVSVSYYERLLKIVQEPTIYFNYALVLSKWGKWEKAVENLQKFLDIYHENDDTKKMAQEMLEKWKKTLI